MFDLNLVHRAEVSHTMLLVQLNVGFVLAMTQVTQNHKSLAIYMCTCVSVVVGAIVGVVAAVVVLLIVIAVICFL